MTRRPQGPREDRRPCLTPLDVVHGRGGEHFLLGWRALAAGRGLAAPTGPALHLLAQPACLLFQAGLDFTAPLSPRQHTHAHVGKEGMQCGGGNRWGNSMRKMSHSPGLFDGYVAVEFFQAVFSGVVVHNKDAFFHVGPLGPFEDRHRGSGALV